MGQSQAQSRTPVQLKAFPSVSFCATHPGRSWLRLRDGRPDVVASHDDTDLVTVLLGDGQGDFKPAHESPLPVGFRTFEVVAVDFDRDGNVDLAGAGEKGIAILLGNGRGSFKRAQGSPFRTGKGTWRLAVADLNGDNKLDIVAGNVESNDISVLLMK